MECRTNSWHFVDFTDHRGMVRSLMTKRVRRGGPPGPMVNPACWLVFWILAQIA